MATFHAIEERHAVLDQFSRTRLVFGNEGVEALRNARVIVFGCGGVGGYVCESLVRSGLGAIDIVDDDKVCLTNINRQVIATWKTIGEDKVDAMEQHLLDISPDCKITKHKCFYLPDTAGQFDFAQYDYIVDCVDTVTAKWERPSSPLWEQATSWTLPPSASPTFRKRPSAAWRASSAKSCANEASRD